MDVLEAEARAGKTVVATTHDLACAAHRFQEAALVNRRIVATGPAKDLILDQRLLAATYGGHVLVLPDLGGRPARGSSTTPTTTTSRPPASSTTTRRTGGEPRRSAGRPDGLRVHAARPGGRRSWSASSARSWARSSCCVGWPSSATRSVTRPCPAWSSPSCWGSRSTSEAPSRPSPRRSRSGPSPGAGGLRFDTAVGVLFAGTFALGVLLFSTIRNYITDLFSFLLGNILGITATDLVAIAVLGAVVVGTIALLRKELLYATFDPAGAGRVRAAGDAARVPAPGAARGDDRGQHPGGRDHHGRGHAGHPGGDRASSSSPASTGWSWWRSRSRSSRRSSGST